VIDLDLRRLDVDEVACLPGPGKVLELLAGDPAAPDLLDGELLVRTRPLVDVEDPRPRRTVLVVAVAGCKRDVQAGEIGFVRRAVDDLPREGAFTDVVRGTAAGDAVDPPAGADRVAVARLEVRAGDAPGAQAALSATTRSSRASR
jgi:hypothetical protein